MSCSLGIPELLEELELELEEDDELDLEPDSELVFESVFESVLELVFELDFEFDFELEDEELLDLDLSEPDVLALEEELLDFAWSLFWVPLCSDTYSSTSTSFPFLSLIDIILPALSFVRTLCSESSSTVPPSAVVSSTLVVSETVLEAFLSSPPHEAIKVVRIRHAAKIAIILFIYIKITFSEKYYSVYIIQ